MGFMNPLTMYYPVCLAKSALLALFSGAKVWHFWQFYLNGHFDVEIWGSGNMRSPIEANTTPEQKYMGVKTTKRGSSFPFDTTYVHNPANEC